MKKKLTQQQNIDELTDKYKLSKAQQALNELKATQTKDKVWINSKKYFPKHPVIYIEVDKDFTTKQIIERLEILLNL